MDDTVSLDGGGASEGKVTGMRVGGATAEARECRNAIDSSFFSSNGYRSV